jgi:hypothetical protein
MTTQNKEFTDAFNKLSSTEQATFMEKNPSLFALPTPTTYTKVDRYSTETRNINENPAVNVPQPSEVNIREQYRARAQGTVDAIKSQFEKYINEDTAAKKSLESKAYLSSLASGLSGSPTGATQTYNAAETGQKKVRQDIQDRETQIQTALSNADLRASQEYDQKRKEYLASAQDKATAEKSLSANVKSAAEGELKSYAKSRSYDEWAKEAGPQRVQQYMNETGMDSMALKQFFINSKPASEKVIDKQIGNNWVIGHRDPITNEIKLETIPLPAGGGSWKFQTIEGKGYFINTDTQQIKLATGEGAPSGKQVTGAPSGFTDEDINKGAQFLQNSGANGYASPNMYVALWKQFVETDGGQQATFLKLYPPDQYIRPEDADLLPTFLQPKVKKSVSPSSSTASGTGRAF